MVPRLFGPLDRKVQFGPFLPKTRDRVDEIEKFLASPSKISPRMLVPNFKMVALRKHALLRKAGRRRRRKVIAIAHPNFVLWAKNC